MSSTNMNRAITAALLGIIAAEVVAIFYLERRHKALDEEVEAEKREHAKCMEQVFEAEGKEIARMIEAERMTLAKDLEQISDAEAREVVEQVHTEALSVMSECLEYMDGVRRELGLGSGRLA